MKFCSNCGAELSENTKFCEACGHPVEDQPVTEQKAEGQSAVGGQGEFGNTGGNQAAPGRKSKAPLFAGLGIAVIAVLIGVFAFAMPMLKKANMSPAEYMIKAEKDQRDERKDALTGYFEQVKAFSGDNLEKTSNQVTIKIKPEEGLKSLIAQYAPLAGIQTPDLSKINDLGMDVTVGKNGSAMAEKMLFKINDADILTANAYMDISNQKMYYQIPELSSSYLDVSSVLSSASSGDESGLLGTAGAGFLSGLATGETLPTTEEISKIYDRYTDVLINSIKKATKEADKKCEAGGVSQEVAIYTAKYTGKEMTAVLNDLLDALKNDEQILKYAKQAGIDEKDYKDGIDAASASVKGLNDGSGYLEFLDYIAEDGIVGREIKVYEKKGGKVAADIQMFEPKDGDKFGYLLSVQAEDKDFFSVSGKGTLKSDVMDGDFSVKVPVLKDNADLNLASDEILTIKVSGYDTAKAKEGEASGKWEIQSPALAMLGAVKMTITESGKMGDAKMQADLEIGGQKMLTLDLAAKTGEKMDISEPDSGDVLNMTDENAMTKYSESMMTGLAGVMEKIKEQTGIDLASLLEDTGAGETPEADDSYDLGNWGDVDLGDVTEDDAQFE